jgi:Na+-driven multidrug efflux pump
MLIQDFWVSLHSEGKFQHMWVSWGRSSTDSLSTFLEYVIPTATMEATNILSMELFVLMAGYGITHKINQRTNEKIDFSAQVVTMNLFQILEVLPVGVGFTISAIVGIYQAQIKSNIAKKISNIAWLYGQVMMVISCVLFYQYREKILNNYLNSQDTKEVIFKNLPLIFGFYILQASLIMLTGTIKGLGIQNKAVLWTFIAYFGIGLPLSYFLAFRAQQFTFWQAHPQLKHVQGFTGFFLGFVIASFLLNLKYAQLIYCRNWRTHAKQMLEDLNIQKVATRRPQIVITQKSLTRDLEYQPLLTDINEFINGESTRRDATPVILEVGMENSSELFYSISKETPMHSEMSLSDISNTAK